MLVKEVLLKYHKMVPFPWSLPKISKAGYVPREFFLDLGNELKECEDMEHGLADDVLQSIDRLRNQTP